MASTSTSNLISCASSSSGLKITSVSVKKGSPTILKYSWTYKENSPDYITVAVIGVSGKDLIVLAGNWFAKGEGKSGELIATLDISVLKGFPGEFILIFVSDDVRVEVERCQARRFKVNDESQEVEEMLVFKIGQEAE